MEKGNKLIVYKLCLFNIKANKIIDRLLNINEIPPTQKEINKLNDEYKSLKQLLINTFELDLSKINNFLTNIENKKKVTSNITEMTEEVKNVCCNN